MSRALVRYANGLDLSGRVRTPGSMLYSLRMRRAAVLRTLFWAYVVGAAAVASCLLG